jgi:hypothetical protein
MLWPSIRRWKFQRSRIGRLPARDWCLNIVCAAISSGLAISTPPSSSRLPRCCVHSCDGSAFASQSTMRPIMLNSSASNTPQPAVKTVIAAIAGRAPAVQAHTKAKKLRGGAVTGWFG